MDINTITALAKKFQAIINPANKATVFEQNTAARMLENLLKKHGLTEESLADQSKATYSFVLPRLDQYRKVLVQVACTILDKREISTHMRYVVVPKKSERTGKPLKSCVKALEVLVDDLTVVQFTDISCCYAHYARILDKRLHELRKEAKLNRMATANAGSALIHRFMIFPETREEGESAAMTPEEIAAIIAAMRGMSGSKWLKPIGNLSESSYLPLPPPRP